MTENAKYEIVSIATTNSPQIQSLSAAYILTMRDSSRMDSFDTRLYSIAPRTYIQYNSGYNTAPVDYVDSTSRDLAHAVQNICKHAMTNQYDYILILEDDAFLLCPKRLASVDRRLHKGVDIYTFGSVGWFVPIDCNHARVIGNFLGFAQAIIYSRKTQSELVQRSIKDIKHIDVHFLAKRGKKYATIAPTIVQLLPPTNNMQEWSLSHKGNICEACGLRIFLFFIHRVLGMDRHPRGWYVLYAFNYGSVPIAVTLVTLLIWLYS